MLAQWFNKQSKTNRFSKTVGLLFLFLLIISLGGYWYYQRSVKKIDTPSVVPATRFIRQPLEQLDQTKLNFKNDFSVKPVDWVDVQLENKITVNNSGEKLALTPVGADLSRREFVGENQTEVIYREVYPGVDFKYSAAKDHLKEDIIVKDQQSAGQFSFSFVLDDDLQLIHESDGGYLVKKGESYLYYFYPFTAVDAAGKKIDYQTSIVGEENNTFVIVAKPKKLADLQAATYPVVIDPTITWTFPLSSPTLSTISPNSGPTAGGQEVTLTGTNFFGYKQTINVSYSGSALTNFVGKFYLDTASLINAGRMRSDCGDLRVYQGNTKLSYQLVSGCGTASTQVNVLIPSISGSTSLELYYGDADLTSESTDIGPLTSFTATDSLVYFAATLNGSETPTYQTITTRNASIPVEFYKFYGDRTISGTTYLGAGAADANMLMARYEGNLTIDSGAIFTPNARKRGMVLYVDGNLTINGRISMNGRGAFGVAGQDILIFDENGSQYSIPATGGAGGGRAYSISTASADGNAAGNNGGAGSNGGTGGGGSGAANHGVKSSGAIRSRGYSGAGSAGTSYSGGAGGGAISRNNGNTKVYYAGNGAVNGGAGGAGSAYRANSGWVNRCAGGGAGNNGGAGSSAGCTGSAGQAGTGGLLIIFAKNIHLGATGQVFSQGYAGGNSRIAGGGGSGGGSINLFYDNVYDYETGATVLANGGARGTGSGSTTYGGYGGDGTFRTVAYDPPVLPVLTVNSTVSKPIVKFGTLEGVNLRVINSTTIKVLTPASSAGTVNVSLTNFDAKSASKSSGYTYITPPTVTSVDLASIPKTGNTVINIYGSAFYGTPTVTFNGVAATGVMRVNSGNLRVTAPAGDVGPINIVVTNPDGQFYKKTKISNYVELAPTILSINPNSGSINGSTTVTISGNNFLAKNSGGESGWATAGYMPSSLSQFSSAVVGDYIYFFGGYNGSTASSKIFRAPVSNPLNVVDLDVNLPTILYYSNLAIIGDYIYLFGGYSSTYANVIYRAPVSDPTAWTNTGKYLPTAAYGSTIAVVNDRVYLFGGYSGSAYANTIYSAPVSDPTTWTNTGKTLPTASVYAQIATIGDNLYLFGGHNGSNYLNTIYSAPVGDPTTWTNTGKTLPITNAYQQMAVIGDYVYMFGGYNNSAINTILKAPVSDPTTWTTSANTLSTALRLGQAMVIDDYVYLFGGNSGSVSNVIYRAPVQHFRANLYNYSWQTNWLTVASDQSEVTIGGQALNDAIVVNTTTITAVTPANAAGYYDVRVTNYDDQSAVLSNGYQYIPPPSISNVNPMVVAKDSSQTITITGNYFWGTPTVTFNGQAATSVELLSPTTLSVVISSTVAGKAKIRITNPDGQAATFDNFVFKEPAPTISGALTPSEGPYVGGTEVTMTGANFLPYRQAINVSYTGSPLTDYVEQLSLDTASLIAEGKMRNDCADLELRYGQVPLERQIIDCNSEGTQIYVRIPQLLESTEIQFYYGNLSLVFSNASLTPTELPEGQSAPNFTITEQVDGPIIKLGGVTSTVTTINSANSISFVTPPGNVGLVTATLTNYDNQVAFSAENAFEYLAGPQIASVSPLSAFANESVEMVISGANFRQGAQVKFYSVGDESFSCTSVIFDSQSTLRCQVDWSNRKWGYWHVEVINPDGQVLVKNKAFYLNPLPPNILSVQPSYGPMSGGTELTITGENFIGPTGVGYYREILLSYSGAALTDYRKVLTIDTKSLIDAGKMRSDCGDLRFWDSDGKTNLSYWLKSGCNTNNTQVVVAIPAISGDKTIYWCYGDSTLTSASQVLGADLAFWAKDLTGSTTVTNYTINTKYADIPVEFYNYTGNTTISSNTNLGSATADSRMLMARYNGNLTINSGATLTAAARKRGMVLYVDGDLTVNGTISMTARGAYNVAGQNVLILDENGVEYKIPAAGGSGGSRVYTIAPAKGEATAVGKSGTSNSSGGTGGGASGGSQHGGGSISAKYYRSRGYSGAGSAGTSYSGGAGGGGINRNNGNTNTYYAADAGASGGAGGAGNAYTAFAAGRAASGGAGNNGGAASSAGATGAAGSNGTGGLLILMVSGNLNIGSTGSIVSKGSNGGAFGAGGGASGGGSVNLFYGNQYQSSGTLSATGGVGGGSPRGGHGGNGTVRTVKFSEDIYQIGPEYRLLSVELDSLNGINPQIINSQTIKVTTPSTTVSGLVDVKVNNAGSQSVTLENSFFYLSDNYVLITKPDNLRVGQAGQFVIQARDVYGNVVVGNDDVVFQLSSNSATGFFARDLNESPDTRWNYVTAIMPAGSSEVIFYYQDNQKGNVTLSITPVVGVALTPLTYSFPIISQYRFLVTGISDPIKVGVPSSVTIQAVNADGSPLYDYSGTVAFSSNDNSAILPPNATFTSRNLGGRTLVNEVTFLTENQAEGWCFNVTDVSDSNINGSQCAITVGAPNIGISSKIGFITDPQFIEVDSASAPITIQLQDTEGSPVSKTTSTTLYLYSQSATGQFSANGLDSWVSEPFPVTVPPYASSINVYYRDSVLGNYSITASDDNTEGVDFGLTNATQAISVVVGGAYSFHLSPISFITTAGDTGQELTVNLKDNSGNVVTALNNQAFFASASNGGLVSLNGVNWSNQIVGYINAGLSSQVFYFKSNKSGQANIVVSDSSPANGAEGLTDASASATVQAGSFSKLNIVAASVQLIAGQPSSAMTVQATDQYNNLVNVSANTSVYLYKNQPEIDFSSTADFSSTLDSLVIPTGQASVNFYLKARANIGSTVVTASDGTPAADGVIGLVDDSLNVDITPGSLHHFAITNTGPINLAAGATELITLEGRNAYDIVTPSDLNRMIYFQVNPGQATDEFSLGSGVEWSPITFSTMSKGNSSMNVYYRPIKSGTRQLVLGDDNGLIQDQNIINASAVVNVAAGTANRLNIANLSTNLLAGQESSLAILSLTDSYGNLANNNQDRPIGLSSSLASGYFFGANHQTTTSLTIPYGQATSSFYYLSTMAGEAVVTAADQEFSATSSVSVAWGDITTFAIDKENNTVKAGTSTGPIVVRSVNDYGVTIPFTTETAVNFNSTATSTGFFDFSQTGLFDGSIVSHTLAAGSSTLTLFYKDTKAGEPWLNFATLSGLNASTTLTVVPDDEYQLAFVEGGEQVLEVGQKSNVLRLSVQDKYKNPIRLSAARTVNLLTTSARGGFATSTANAFNLTSVTIPADSTSTDIYYQDIEAGSPVLRASTMDLLEATATTTINPAELTTLTLTTATNYLTAGQASEAITLALYNDFGQPAPSSSDLTINLTGDLASGKFATSTANEFNLTSLVIPAGATSTTFYFTETVAGAHTITAATPGLTSGQLNLTVEANVPAALSFITSPQTIIAGAASAPIVVQFLDSFGNVKPLAAPTTVTLTSTAITGSFSATSSGPWNYTEVTGEIGATAAIFHYRDTKSGIAGLSVSSVNLTSDNQNITINPAALDHFRFASSAQSLKALQISQPITIEALDQFNNLTKPTSTVNFNLTTTSTKGYFSAVNDPWATTTAVQLTSSQNAFTFYYYDSSLGQPQLTVQDTNSSYPAISQTQTIITGDLAKLVFSSSPETIVAGTVSDLITFNLTDLAGNLATSSTDILVTITSTSTTALFKDIQAESLWANSFNLTVPAGQSSGSFYFQDTTPGQTIITLASDGLAGDSLAEDISAGSPTTLTLTTATNYLTAGQASEAITLALYNDFGQPAPSSSDLTINLTGDLASGKFATSTANEFNLTSLVIPAGATSTTFYFTETVAGAHTITAATPGLTSGQLNLTVEANVPAALSFITSPQTIIAGAASAPIVVQFLDSFGNVKPLAAPTTVTLTSTAITGSFSATSSGPWNYTEVTGEIGATAAIFHYRDTKSGIAGLSVSSVNLTSDNQNITINPAALDHFRFASSAQSLKALQISQPITIEALDQFNNLTKPTSTVNFNLTTTSTKGYFSAVNDPWATTTAVQLTSSQNAFTFYYYDSSLGQPQLTVQDTNSSYPAISQTQTIITGDLAKLVFSSSPETIVAGTVSDLITFNLTDLAGNLATSSTDILVTITSTSTTALFKDIQAESLWANSFNLTVPAGQSSGSFYFQDTTPGQTIITLASDGLAGDSLVENLTIGYPAKIEIVGSAIFSAGAITPFTVQLKDNNDLVVPALTTTTIALANDMAGEFSLSSNNWQAITSLEIPTGNQEQLIYFRSTTAGNGQLTASENPAADLTAGLLNIEISPASIYRLKVINKPEAIVVNQPSTVFTAQLQDEFGNIVNLSAADVAGTETADIYLHGSGQFATTTTGVWGIGSVPLRIGESAVSFYYQSSVPGTTTIKVSDQSLNQAFDNGWLDDTVTVAMLGETPSRLSLTATSWTVAAGQALPITITALKENNQPAILGEDLVVDLNANWVNGRFLTTPESASSSLTEITIPAGQSSVQLYAKHNLVGTYVVSANANALSGASQQLKIKSAPAAALKFISSEQTVVAGQDSAVMQVRLVDSYGNPATSTSQRLIGLASNGGDFSMLSGGNFATTTTATVPAGSSDLSFYWRNYRQAGLFSLTVSDLSGQSLPSIQQNITVTAAAAYRLVISSQPINIMTGETSSLIAIAVRDEYGNSQVLPANTTIYLYSTSTAASFSQNVDFITPVNNFILPAGSSGSYFYYRDLTVGQPIITVADQPLYNPGDPDLGLVDGQQLAEIVSGSVAKLKFIDSPSIIRSGDSRLYQVQLQNQYNQPTVATYPLTAYLYTSSAYGRFSATTSFLPTDFITTLNFGNGDSVKDIYYRDTLTGEHTVTVADYVPVDNPDQGLINATRLQTVLSGDPVSLNFINTPQTLIAGQTSEAYTVELRDLYGNVAAATAKVDLYLNSSSNLSGFATSSAASEFNLNQIGIPAGGSTASFYYQDRQENNPLITVTDQQPLDNPDSGLVNATQSQTINWGDVFRIAITSPIPTLEVGQISLAQTVQLQNSYGLGRPAPAATNLYFNTSNPDGGFATASAGPFTATQITIPVGQTSATYYYRQLATGTAQLRISETAPANGPINWLDAEQTLEVVAGQPHRIIVGYAPESVIAKHPSSEINLQIYNSSGYPTTDHTGIRLYLRSSSLVSGTEFAAAATGPWGVNFINVPAGQSSVSAYYRSPKLGTNVLTISDELPAEEGVGLINATVSLEVLTQTIDNFLVTNISDPQVQGTPSSVVVWARDADNYIFEQYNGQVCFTSSDVTAILPECYTFIPEIDHGMHSFINAVTFSQVGEKWVRATAASGHTGVQQNITVTGNSAGAVHHLSFSNVSDNLIRLSQEEVVGPITVQLFDTNNQPVNASEGGYPVHLKTSSATGQFSLSADGPWLSELDQIIPAGISSFNFYYRDYINGSSVVVASDWIDGLNNLDIGDASLVAEVTGLQVDVNKVIEGHSVRQALWTVNPMIFSNQNSGRNYEGRATFDIAIKDFNSGNPQIATVDLVLKNPAGQVVATSTLSGQSSYTYQAYPLGGDGNYHIPENSGNWTLGITAVSESGVRGVRTETIPVSAHLIEIDYQNIFAQKGKPIVFDIKVTENSVLTDAEAIVLNWIDNNGNFIPGSTLNLNALTRTATGTYSGQMPTTLLTVGEKFYLGASLRNAQGHILAEDSHGDIQVVNNPALAAKNFTVEKIVTSIPPAPETYNLRFTWQSAANAVRYRLFYTQNKFARLFSDACSVAQVRAGGRASSTCDTIINMSTSTNAIEDWYQFATVDEPVTEYTIVNAQNISFNPLYFLLRADNGNGQESGFSTMSFVNRLGFNYNSSLSNINWISIPYVPSYYTNSTALFSRQMLDRSSILIGDIEGGRGLNTNQKVKRVSLWDPASQGTIKNYTYRSGGAFNKWTGVDFTITPGGGLFLETSASVANFDWTMVGSDKQSAIDFVYNGPSATNIYWLSLPYSSMYGKASDIVSDIEGGTGLGTNQKIKRISLWDPSNQGTIKNYAYRAGGAFNKWTGVDFAINPGSGVFVELSGNTPEFSWTPALLVEPYN